MADHVFISYARSDRAYVDALKDDLRRHGFQPWNDENVEPGERWWRTIVQAIRECSAFLVVMTPDSDESKWVEKEILLALEEKKEIFPLLLRGRRFPLLIDTQYENLTSGQLPSESFYKRLGRVISQKGVTIEAPLEPESLSPKLLMLGVLVAIIGVAWGVYAFYASGNVPVTPAPTSKPAATIAAIATQPIPIVNSPIPTLTNTPIPLEDKPAPAGAAATPQTITASDVSPMVLVPAGPFEMGSESVGSSERPVHTVTLDSFYIDTYEVTNAQYAACVAAGGCVQPACPERYEAETKKNHPVVCVSWYQAQKYCEWRGGRLPTEAEWEKAARGTDGRTYPWGDKPPDGMLLNFDRNVADTTPVGNYPKGVSPYGAYDMAGNAWEWVADWYDENYYSNSPAENPLGPQNGDYKVLRGGGWQRSESNARVTYRNVDSPGNQYIIFGFRCAADAP